jgi:hypothetical protein
LDLTSFFAERFVFLASLDVTGGRLLFASNNAGKRSKGTRALTLSLEEVGNSDGEEVDRITRPSASSFFSDILADGLAGTDKIRALPLFAYSSPAPSIDVPNPTALSLDSSITSDMMNSGLNSTFVAKDKLPKTLNLIIIPCNDDLLKPLPS